MRIVRMQEEKGLGLYNLVIIGAGTAGLVTAAGTAGLGGRVALFERNKTGGDCSTTAACRARRSLRRRVKSIASDTPRNGV